MIRLPYLIRGSLTANNLSSYIQYPALAQKALLSDPSQSNSLVNQLGNTNLLNTAKSFDFAKNGLAALQNPKVIATLTNAYAEVLWRQSLEKATPGLSNALAFLGQASSIKTVDDILEELGPLVREVHRAPEEPAVRHPAELSLSDLERSLLGLLDDRPMAVDELIGRTGMTASQVLATLSVLELRRLVRRVPGHQFVRA